jgi:DNA-binding CsgD family transcriptional regulator
LTEQITVVHGGLARQLLRVAEGCTRCACSRDFAALVRHEVRPLLPHTSLIAALGRIDLEHLELMHVESVDYPPRGLLALQRQSNVKSRPALAHWLNTRRPLVLDADADGAHLSDAERQEIDGLELGRVAAHGVLDLAARSGSYFSFGGLSSHLAAPDVAHRLSLVVPHLHQALVRCHQSAIGSASSGPKLSGAEREILRWVAAGRTNAEIACLRGRSESTVRNQLTTLFRKLGVSNRAAAVRMNLSWM